jgi:hypothetical protein
VVSFGISVFSLNSFGFTLPENLNQLSVVEANFEGIVALNNCSGSVVRFLDSQPSDRALVMTNGHCLGSFIEPGGHRYRVATNRSFQVLDQKAKTLGTVQSDSLVYATMTQTDLAFYRLTITYQDFQSRFGFEALTISPDLAQEGTEIEILSGYWRQSYNCAIEAVAFQVFEGDWIFESSLRYTSACQTKGGTSGSPILDAQSRMVIGINNSRNESGQKCTINNPCESDESGNVQIFPGRGYGQQIAWAYTCLNKNREIDLMTQGCELPGAEKVLALASGSN